MLQGTHIVFFAAAGGAAEDEAGAAASKRRTGRCAYIKTTKPSKNNTPPHVLTERKKYVSKMARNVSRERRKERAVPLSTKKNLKMEKAKSTKKKPSKKSKFLRDKVVRRHDRKKKKDTAPEETHTRTMKLDATTNVDVCTKTKRIPGRHPFNDAVIEMGRLQGKALEQLEEEFNQRALGFRMTSVGHQNSMRRMLPFLLVPAKKRSEVFMKLAKGRIGAGTRSGYWVILMSLEVCLRPADRAPDEKKVNTRLQQLSQTEAATIIRPTCTYMEIDKWTGEVRVRESSIWVKMQCILLCLDKER
jgi:hypothetical protein